MTDGFPSQTAVMGKVLPPYDVILTKNFDTLTRTSVPVREWKINSVACAQLTFQMLTLQTNISIPPESVFQFMRYGMFGSDSSNGYSIPLRWRHNGRDSVSNHQPHDCLLNRLCRSKKTLKLRVTGLCARNSPGTGEFPAQMASNAENVSIWWRHHAAWIGRLESRVLGSRDMFCLKNFGIVTRTPVLESKIDGVAHIQFIFNCLLYK